MIGYIIEGVAPGGAMTDPRTKRLRTAGPWKEQGHIKGTLITWADFNGGKDSFGPERTTFDGLTYLPPKIIPTPEQLIREDFKERQDLEDVFIQMDDDLVKLRLCPAYLSPRKVLDNSGLGDFSTAFGRRVRELLVRVNDQKLKMGDIMEDLIECDRQACMYVYRTTRELLSDCAWINEDSINTIWGAIINVPKDNSAPGDAPSA